MYHYSFDFCSKNQTIISKDGREAAIFKFSCKSDQNQKMAALEFRKKKILYRYLIRPRHSRSKRYQNKFPQDLKFPLFLHC